MSETAQKQPLVSIITPCYNGGWCVSRMIESVLAQSYPNIEYIVVDDGSTDNSAEIIKGYMPAFEEREYTLVYFWQENRGVAGAIQTGLKLFTGDYLCWVDQDDWLEPDSVEIRVRFLEENTQYGVVTGDANVRLGMDLDRVAGRISEKFPHSGDENQFEWMLKGESIFCPGCHMIRVSTFHKANPKRQIYDKSRGQNWQLLLPLYYLFPCKFLPTPVYNYVVYYNSVSHAPLKYYHTWEEFLTESCDTIFYTLEQIEETQGVDLSEKKKSARVTYARTQFRAALQYGEKAAAKRHFHALKQQTKPTMTDCLLYVLRGMSGLYRFASRLRKAIRRKRKK